MCGAPVKVSGQGIILSTGLRLFNNPLHFWSMNNSVTVTSLLPSFQVGRSDTSVRFLDEADVNADGFYFILFYSILLFFLICFISFYFILFYFISFYFT
jgi:hypothetical protein